MVDLSLKSIDNTNIIIIFVDISWNIGIVSNRVGILGYCIFFMLTCVLEINPKGNIYFKKQQVNSFEFNQE